MPQTCLETALQNIKKDNKEHIKPEKQNLNKVFVPHHCHCSHLTLV